MGGIGDSVSDTSIDDESLESEAPADLFAEPTLDLTDDIEREPEIENEDHSGSESELVLSKDSVPEGIGPGDGADLVRTSSLDREPILDLTGAIRDTDSDGGIDNDSSEIDPHLDVYVEPGLELGAEIGREAAIENEDHSGSESELDLSKDSVPEGIGPGDGAELVRTSSLDREPILDLTGAIRDTDSDGGVDNNSSEIDPHLDVYVEPGLELGAEIGREAAIENEDHSGGESKLELSKDSVPEGIGPGDGPELVRTSSLDREPILDLTGENDDFNPETAIDGNPSAWEARLDRSARPSHELPSEIGAEAAPAHLDHSGGKSELELREDSAFRDIEAAGMRESDWHSSQQSEPRLELTVEDDRAAKHDGTRGVEPARDYSVQPTLEFQVGFDGDREIDDRRPENGYDLLDVSVTNTGEDIAVLDEVQHGQEGDASRTKVDVGLDLTNEGAKEPVVEVNSIAGDGDAPIRDQAEASDAKVVDEIKQAFGKFQFPSATDNGVPLAAEADLTNAIRDHVSRSLEGFAANTTSGHKIGDYLEETGQVMQLEELVYGAKVSGVDPATKAANIALDAGCSQAVAGTFAHKILELRSMYHHPDEFISGERLAEQSIETDAGRKEVDEVLVRGDVHYLRDLKPIELAKFEQGVDGKAWSEWMTANVGPDFRDQIRSGTNPFQMEDKMPPEIRKGFKDFVYSETQALREQVDKKYRDDYSAWRGVPRDKIDVSIRPYWKI